MKGSFLDYPKYLAPVDDNDRAEDNDRADDNFFEVLGSKNQLQIIAKKIGAEFIILRIDRGAVYCYNRTVIFTFG